MKNLSNSELKFLFDKLLYDCCKSDLSETSLNSKGIDIFYDYYWNGLTYSEIGRKYNRSRTRVGQVIERIRRRLRHPSRVQILNKYYVSSHLTKNDTTV